MQHPVNSQTNTESAEQPESVAELTARLHRLRRPVAKVQRDIRAAEYAILQTEFA